MKPQGSHDSAYKGTEYMSIYPYIVCCDGTEKYTSGDPIEQGYYVRWLENGSYYITPLAQWFKER